MPTIVEEDKNLLGIFNEINRIRGKQELLHIIRNTLKFYISFDDGFILRYNKSNQTGRPYIFHSEKQHPASQAIRSYLDLEYSVPDYAVDEFNYPTVYNISSATQFGVEPLELMRDAGIKEFVVVKLLDGNELTGIFLLLSANANSFKPKDLEFLYNLSNQLSMAFGIIIAHEEMIKREEEKSILLSLSNEIASVKSKKELANLLEAKLTGLFPISGFGITLLNDDHQTHSPFIVDAEKELKQDTDFKKVINLRYKVMDGVFNRSLIQIRL